MPRKIEFVEVGTRDGFQNVTDFIPTEIKIETLERLIDSGVKTIQFSSFVSPKAIPQLRDAEIIAKETLSRHPEVSFMALVPNLKGAQNANASGVKKVNYVISVSESHNKANVNRTVDESFAELKKIIDEFGKDFVTLDAATAFGCPFEGYTTYKSLKEFILRGVALGINEFCIADTIGVATPNQVREYMSNLLKDFPDKKFGVHIHDTRNMGMVNNLVAIEAGVYMIQASIGGLGGCPFAPGATGNTSSEDLIYMLNKMGYDTGIDSDKIIETAKFVKDNVNGNFSGHHINITRKYN
ncbi:MAG: hydroxymethylglutaryl-CoA lyase [Lachnospiraceae bacterium]|nr:hydroxymethylglutaryl-CoA lyase [Lachnospiraceae bacterium]